MQVMRFFYDSCQTKNEFYYDNEKGMRRTDAVKNGKLKPSNVGFKKVIQWNQKFFNLVFQIRIYMQVVEMYLATQTLTLYLSYSISVVYFFPIFYILHKYLMKRFQKILINKFLSFILLSS
jgi:hypothetical protein